MQVTGRILIRGLFRLPGHLDAVSHGELVAGIAINVQFIKLYAPIAAGRECKSPGVHL